MDATTVKYWDYLHGESPKKTGIRVQNQINMARREYAREAIARFTGTQSDCDEPVSCTDVSSGSGIGSWKKIVNAHVQRKSDLEEVRKVLDARVWFKTGDLLASSPKSTPSSNRASIPVWISYIRNNMTSLNEREQLAERVSLLAKEIVQDEGVTINEESLAAFAMFLSSNKIEKRPSIGITSNGYIDALWRRSKDFLIEIIFCPGDESQIVTFSPDLTNANLINKRVATLPIKTIMKVIKGRKLDSSLYGSNVHNFAQAI